MLRWRTHWKIYILTLFWNWKGYLQVSGGLHSILNECIAVEISRVAMRGHEGHLSDRYAQSLGLTTKIGHLIM